MGAPKGNRNAVGNKGGGRKSTYKPEYAELARKLCPLGATDKEIGGCGDEVGWAVGKAACSVLGPALSWTIPCV
jgi:hypothetical protein